MKPPNHKRILLGITGGIAAYKSPSVARRLRERGCQVRVVMTAAATQFITPLTLQAVSGNAVHQHLLDEGAESGMGHIELARWAEQLVVAPASADFIARLAHGRSNDLLCAVALATAATITLAPAMNRMMWQHPATQRNVAELAARGVRIIGPGAGSQACGESGAGRMSEPEEIAAQVVGAGRPRSLAGVSVLMTAGPTWEALDPVRGLSNHSSGKMGYAMAQAAADVGAEVTLVSGPVDAAVSGRVCSRGYDQSGGGGGRVYGQPGGGDDGIDGGVNGRPGTGGIDLIAVRSAQEMLDAVLARAATADVFIGVAAVADYRPAAVSAQKIKKKAPRMRIDLIQNPDILATVAALKKAPFTVGFAAETENVLAHAREKGRRKGVDIMLANHVAEVFGRDENSVTVIDCRRGGVAGGAGDGGEITGEITLPRTDKYRLSRQIIEHIAPLVLARRKCAHPT